MSAVIQKYHGLKGIGRIAKRRVSMLKGMFKAGRSFFLLRGSTDHTPTFFAYRLQQRIINLRFKGFNGHDTMKRKAEKQQAAGNAPIF